MLNSNPASVSTLAQTFTVPADLTRSTDVRRFAREFFFGAGFGAVWSNRLVLVVDELFMNAVKYGSRANEQIVLNFTQEDESVICAITDHGASGITPEELRKRINNHGDTHTPNKTSGRGLAIITENWTNGYEVAQAIDGGITITFTKKLEADPIKIKAAKTVTESDITTIISLAGEIEENNVNAKTAAIEAFIDVATNSRLALDLTHVSFINSIFLGKLASWHNLLIERGGDLTLLHIQPQVHDILELVGLDQIIAIK